LISTDVLLDAFADELAEVAARQRVEFDAVTVKVFGVGIAVALSRSRR
jgi:hypothetical protein